MTTAQPDRIGPYQITRELAQAQHRTGDTAAAIQTQRHAIGLASENEELRAALARYETALTTTEPNQPDGGGS